MIRKVLGDGCFSASWNHLMTVGCLEQIVNVLWGGRKVKFQSTTDKGASNNVDCQCKANTDEDDTEDDDGDVHDDGTSDVAGQAAAWWVYYRCCSPSLDEESGNTLGVASAGRGVGAGTLAAAAAKFPPDVLAEMLENSAVKKAMAMAGMLRVGNYVRFFRAFRTLPYLDKCALQRQLTDIRHAAMVTVCKATATPQGTRIRLRTLADLLGFNSDREAAVFLGQYLGLTVDRLESGVLVATMRRDTPPSRAWSGIDDAPRFPLCSDGPRGNGLASLLVHGVQAEGGRDMTLAASLTHSLTHSHSCTPE